jgi:hypothetical protein
VRTPKAHSTASKASRIDAVDRDDPSLGMRADTRDVRRIRGWARMRENIGPVR